MVPRAELASRHCIRHLVNHRLECQAVGLGAWGTFPLTPSNKKGEECQEVTQQFGKTLPQTLREEKQRTHVTHIHNSLLPSAALVAAAVFAIGVENEFSADAFQKL